MQLKVEKRETFFKYCNTPEKGLQEAEVSTVESLLSLRNVFGLVPVRAFPIFLHSTLEF